jgi:nucleoside-diphosphate-sugar epimerase
VKRFIYTGTIDSYDSAAADKVIIADTPLDRRMRTRNLYARSKAACEDLLHRMSRNNGLPLIITRPGIVIGAGADPTHIGVANFTGPGQVQYWGSGQNKLPLVLVDDVADALVRVLDAPDVVGRTFLLTGHPILSAREYVAELDSRAAVRISARHQAAWIYWVADFAKEFVKRAIRHPNRRSSTLHDWECRSHRSTYDNSSTRRALGWAPVSDRDELVERGIAAALDVRASQTQAEVPPSKSARKKRHTDGRAR